MVVQTQPVETKEPWRPGVGAASPVFRSLGRAHVAWVAFGLLAVLSGCAVRAPRPDGLQTQANLPDRTTHRLITAWESQLTQYINAEGGGDPAVLARTRVLHSRDVRRPARITFDALDVDAAIPGRDGWDVEGVFIGKQSTGARNWYVFLVGVVSRSGYRPGSIQDIRLVAMSTHGDKFSWVVSPQETQAVQRYGDTFRDSMVERFPAETDKFVMHVDADRLWVEEVRSGASWSLQQGADDILISSK
jgi:hypothetical protein